MYIVRLINGSCTYYLKGTTWTGSTERADKFDTIEEAANGLGKAKKFTQPKLFKRAETIPLNETTEGETV